jgi:hypothetical protein
LANDDHVLAGLAHGKKIEPQERRTRNAAALLVDGRRGHVDV